MCPPEREAEPDSQNQYRGSRCEGQETACRVVVVRSGTQEPGNVVGVYVVIEGRRMPVSTLLERRRAVMAARRAGYDRLAVMVQDASGRATQVDTIDVSSNGWWLEALADRLGEWMSRRR